MYKPVPRARISQWLRAAIASGEPGGAIVAGCIMRRAGGCLARDSH
jgi:hypothetical protein